MNQARITNLVSKLNYQIFPRPMKLRSNKGPEGRIEKIRKTMNALIKYERIELNFIRAQETRGYVDTLISQIIKYGDQDIKTMEKANFWIYDKQLLHKLLYVLIPRYEKCKLPYTDIYLVPMNYPESTCQRAVLELKGNPFPSMPTNTSSESLLLQNILLNEAKKQYRIEQCTNILDNKSLT